jgi:outer membrane protein TolC
VDLFGATRHRIEAAGASADYEHEQLRAARLRVVGDTVTQALSIASLVIDVMALERNVAEQRISVDVRITRQYCVPAARAL